MTDKLQGSLYEAEAAARAAAFDALTIMLDTDPRVSMLLAQSLAAQQAREAREMSENDPVGVAVRFFHFRDVEQKFFSEGWDGDHSVGSYAGVLAYKGVYETFFYHLLEGQLRSLVDEGLMAEKDDGTWELTDKGQKFAEREINKEQGSSSY